MVTAFRQIKLYRIKFSIYSVALVRFIGPAAQHIIASDSAFNATVYGLVIMKVMDIMWVHLSIT